MNQTAPPTRPAGPAWLPNALTIARLFLVPVVIACLSVDDRWLVIAAIAFIAAAITDALDGYLARRWQVVSRFGRVMDPLADKLLILATAVCLAGPQFARLEPEPHQATGFMPWMACVMLIRELAATSIRGWIEGAGGDFSADWTGKAKMIAQSLGLPTIILLVSLADVSPGTAARSAVLATAWAITSITAVSLLPYIARAIAFARTPTS
ncbi:MAG: CDP-alcohol phosphatidyltransferase family protein [Planctomycetota bacterium]